MMRFSIVVLCMSTAANLAAQTATITGGLFLRDSGRPLGYTTLSLPALGLHRLTDERGHFLLADLPPGELRLRFRRIGFVPVDTTLHVAANDTARLRIELTRLVIQLPEVVVDGTCADRTPLEAQPVSLAQLFDQVRQNAERMRLLALEKPFTIHTWAEQGVRDSDGKFSSGRDTVVASRSPLPEHPYEPGRLIRPGQMNGRTVQMIKLPELPDLADTAFTNNHCFWYAGQERFESDSVIRIDFEPVPWLAKEIDLEGRIYLRLDDYQVVGLVTWLNRMPPGNRVLRDYAVRARFRELVSGIPVITEWTLTNTFRGNRPAFVQSGRVTGVTWRDSTNLDSVPSAAPWRRPNEKAIR